MDRRNQEGDWFLHFFLMCLEIIYLFYDIVILHLDYFFNFLLRLDYLKFDRGWYMDFYYLTLCNWLNLDNIGDLSYYRWSLKISRTLYFFFYLLSLCRWFIFLCTRWLACRFCWFHGCFAFRAFFLCWLCWFGFFLGLWILACRLGRFGSFLFFTLWCWIVCLFRCSLLFRRTLFFRLRLAFRFDWFNYFFIFIIFRLFTLISFFILLAESLIWYLSFIR